MIEVLAQSSTPQPGERAPDGDAAWREAMFAILRSGQKVSPRGIDTVEILHQQLVSVDMARPVVTSFERKLSYQFMAAEALWILEGRNELAPLERFAPSYSKFSDDGLTLNGAYGPKIVDQQQYVVEQLVKDRDTRQAVLTIWERNPRPSKDIPCTVAMSFSIRKGRLHQHVFMRSSDAWMGLPYDMFSFSMVGLWVACSYNSATNGDNVLPGTLTINATSSHIYAKDLDKVKVVLSSDDGPTIQAVPDVVVEEGRFHLILESLHAVREGVEPATWRCKP